MPISPSELFALRRQHATPVVEEPRHEASRNHPDKEH
jgi:hypothetical protein